MLSLIKNDQIANKKWGIFIQKRETNSYEILRSRKNFKSDKEESIEKRWLIKGEIIKIRWNKRR